MRKKESKPKLVEVTSNAGRFLQQQMEVPLVAPSPTSTKPNFAMTDDSSDVWERRYDAAIQALHAVRCNLVLTSREDLLQHSTLYGRALSGDEDLLLATADIGPLPLLYGSATRR